MTADEEMRRYQDEWDNDQYRQRLDPHGEIITDGDLRKSEIAFGYKKTEEEKKCTE